MFDVLSSDTRREILVKLDSHPLTVSDLSKLMGIQKSAIYEHLQILMDAELVYKKESTNKFVYYDLTGKGKALINPDSHPGYKIYIALITSIFFLIGGFIGIAQYVMTLLSISLPGFWGAPGTGTSTPVPSTVPTSIPSGSPIPTFIPTAIPSSIPTGIPLPTPAKTTLFNFAFSDILLIIGIFLTVAGLLLLYYSLSSLNAHKFQRHYRLFTHK